MEKLYPIDWVEPEPDTTVATRGRNFNVARQIVESSVPPGGQPLTFLQIIFLVCGTPLPLDRRKKISEFRIQIASCQATYDSLPDGQEKTELGETIARLQTTLDGLIPPHFVESPVICRNRVLNGLPVSSPPSVRSIRPREVIQLIREEKERRE